MTWRVSDMDNQKGNAVLMEIEEQVGKHIWQGWWYRLNVGHITCELMIKNIGSFRISELENVSFLDQKKTSPLQRSDYPFKDPVLYRTLSAQAKLSRVPKPQVKVPWCHWNCSTDPS